VGDGDVTAPGSSSFGTGPDGSADDAGEDAVAPNVHENESTRISAATVPSRPRDAEVTDREGEDIRRRVPDAGSGKLFARASHLRPVWKGLAAYLIYQSLALLLWFLPVLPRFGDQSFGIVLEDSRFYQWALAWTPYAISHHLNPLHAGPIFAPGGVDLAWSAFAPGSALVLWPITAVFGPLVSFNVAMTAAPALAAWAAYLVCRRLTDRFWPSLVGGSLFGLSIYMAGEIGLLNLVLIFPIPLLLYLVIRRVEGSLGPVAFVAGFAALLVGLFSISTELFGTAAIFGAVAFVGALAFGGEIRRPLLRTGGLIAVAGVAAAIILFPYIHDVIGKAPVASFKPQEDVPAADLVSFVIPHPGVRLGGETFGPMLRRMIGFTRTKGLAYIGFGVLALLVGFAITERRRRATWPLVAFVALALLLALGPVLHVAGDPHGPLPEAALARLPILRHVVPIRFMVYANLAIGVIAALWLARADRRWAWVRWAVALAAVVSLMPTPLVTNPDQTVPAFFTSDQVRRELRPGEVVYAIPAEKGSEMVWQFTSDYRFDLAQGYIGPVPPEVDSGPLADGLHVRPVSYLPTGAELSAWLAQHAVTAVVLDEAASDRYEDVLGQAGLARVFEGGGVSVWRAAMPPGASGLG
jgi:hypothetical protein